MPKLLQINVTANWGSHGRIAEEIGMMAISNGWESYIAYGRYANPSKSHLIKIGNEWDVRIHGIETRLFDRHGLASEKATRTFVNTIECLKPEIIHLHNIHGYYLNYPILFDFLYRYGKPVIWTLHDCWPLTGHCAYPVTKNCEKWMVECRNCPLTKGYPSSYMIDKSKRHYHRKRDCFTSLPDLHIVTVSKWLENIVRNSYLKNYDIRHIYNGIDLSVFRPKEIYGDKIIDQLSLSEKKMILGVANVWDDRKGLLDFYRLREKLDNNYLIILVGLNEKQRKKLPCGIVGMGRANSIHQLAEIYSMADVFVNPSIAETFGMTTAEALSCGTPVIVYNATASPELVDEHTGAVVPVGNIQKMADAIVSLCNSECYSTISETCRKRAEIMFNKHDRFQEYINLYEEILQKR